MFVSEKSTVAGIVLGLVVLVGVTSGFAALLNKRNLAARNVHSVEREIAENDERLATLRSQIEKSNFRIQDELTPRSTQEDQLKTLSGAIASQAEQIASLKAESAAATGEAARIAADARAYRDNYRRQVRKEAIGEKVATLTTRSGRTFQKVEITGVSAYGITIRYESGLARVSSSELDAKWTERFQWSAEETPLEIEDTTPAPPKKFADVR